MNIYHQRFLLSLERLSKLAFDYIIETIKMEYIKSFVEVSEMVGPYCCAEYWRTSNTDDFEYFPLCWCFFKVKCYSWCSTSQGIASYFKVNQVAFNNHLS